MGCNSSFIVSPKHTNSAENPSKDISFAILGCSLLMLVFIAADEVETVCCFLGLGLSVLGGIHFFALAVVINDG